MFPMVNTAAADEHIPKIERYIRTVKEHMRGTYTMLPYCHLPPIRLIHLVKNAVFWLNVKILTTIHHDWPTTVI
jgi:hypothetical protein